MEVGGNTPMHKATEKNMIDIIDKFIAYGGDPTIKNKAGFTCLHIAAREGLVEIVKLLLNKGIYCLTKLKIILIGVDPNIRDTYGFSAAYWAK
jgi:ankyrin repeat protein